MAGSKILIVEDNPLNLELISDILEANGFAVTAAITGAEALKQVDIEAPDLILMDIQLPGIDGLTVTRMIKEKPGLAKIPIVALTAHAMLGDEKKVREAGCDGYISKPIDTRAITKTIQSFLDGTAGDK